MHAGYYAGSLPLRHWIRARLSAQRRMPIIVLFYHRIADDGAKIGTHSNRLFCNQIRWLQRHCDLISLEEAQRRLRNGFNDRLAACITFDDGYSENCDQAYSIFNRPADSLHLLRKLVARTYRSQICSRRGGGLFRPS